MPGIKGRRTKRRKHLGRQTRRKQQGGNANDIAMIKVLYGISDDQLNNIIAFAKANKYGTSDKPKVPIFIKSGTTDTTLDELKSSNVESELFPFFIKVYAQLKKAREDVIEIENMDELMNTTLTVLRNISIDSSPFWFDDLKKNIETLGLSPLLSEISKSLNTLPNIQSTGANETVHKVKMYSYSDPYDAEKHLTQVTSETQNDTIQDVDTWINMLVATSRNKSIVGKPRSPIAGATIGTEHPSIAPQTSSSIAQPSSSVAQPSSSGIAPQTSSSIAQPSSSVAQPSSSGVAQPSSSGVAQPSSSGVAQQPSSGVAQQPSLVSNLQNLIGASAIILNKISPSAKP